MTKLAIVDAGYGNLHSICAALYRLGAEPVTTADPAVIKRAEHVVLPGVGAAGFAMRRLSKLGLIEPLRQRTKPLLGICLGMQLMFENSEEGETQCLGLLPGRVRALAAAPRLPVPHMGWSRIVSAMPSTGLQNGDFVYFAHSYACDDGDATSALTTYGVPITAAVLHGHLWGAQFHPERSSSAGSAFLSAFLSA